MATLKAPLALTAQAFGPTRAPVRRARHLPGNIYSDPDIYQLEKERIFLKDWLCVGRVEEVENPGDYMTFDVLGEPIVVTRDGDANLHAFANVCAHRGVEVAAGAGNATGFSCPYHGWRYDLQGRLVGAAHMEGAHGFDPAACRLAPLQIGVWAGWIFVTFDGQAGPLSEFVAELDADLAFLHQEECRLAEKHSMEFDCNWKLVVENLLDFYHVATLHKTTLGRGFDITTLPLRLKGQGAFCSFYDRAPAVPGGRTLFGTMPWLESAGESFNCVSYLAPNFNIIFRADYARPFVMWPLSPTRTRLIAYPLFPKSYFERADFAEKARQYREFHELVLEEDLDMVRSLQAAMASRRYRPGPMSHIEAAVHNAIGAYIDRMFGDA